MAEKIAMIGAGVMGAGITQVAVQNGYEVTMTDLNQQILDGAVKRITTGLERGAERGIFEASVKDNAIANIHTSLDLEETVAGASLVIEAVFEEQPLKEEIFAKIDKLAPANAIIASNTSTIPITELAASTSRPEKFIGMHFFNPAYAMRLVEVIKGYHTSDETVEAINKACETLGKTAVLMNDSPGFVVNRLIAPFLNEASMILHEGVTTMESINDAVKLGLNHPMGPFELMDLVGLDITLHEISSIFERTGDSKYRPSPLLKQMVAAGRLGRKTGKGWYEY